MSRPYICVAGLLEDGSAHVRPIAGQLHQTLAGRFGGPFEVGAVVDLGEVRPQPSAPETEDHTFDPTVAATVKALPKTDFWNLLKGASSTSLQTLFGPELETLHTSRGLGAAVLPGKGARSLAVLRTQGTVTVNVETDYGGKQQVRVVFNSDLGELDLGTTDLRVYNNDYTVNKEAVSRVQDLLKSSDEILLGVGLARAFARKGDRKRHWLQANAIYTESDPAWS